MTQKSIPATLVEIKQDCYSDWQKSQPLGFAYSHFSNVYDYFQHLYISYY